MTTTTTTTNTTTTKNLIKGIESLHAEKLVSANAIIKKLNGLKALECKDFNTREEEILPLLNLAVERSAKNVSVADTGAITFSGSNDIAEYISKQEMDELHTDVTELNLLSMKRCWTELYFDDGIVQIRMMNSAPSEYRESFLGNYLQKGFDKHNKLLRERGIKNIKEALTLKA